MHLVEFSRSISLGNPVTAKISSNAAYEAYSFRPVFIESEIDAIPEDSYKNMKW